MAAFEASVMTTLAPAVEYVCIAASAIASLEAVSSSLRMKLIGFAILAFLTALLTSDRASSAAVTHSLFAFGAVRGDIAPMTSLAAGKLTSGLLSVAQPLQKTRVFTG